MTSGGCPCGMSRLGMRVPVAVGIPSFCSAKTIAWWSGAKPLQQLASRDEVTEAVKRALDKAGIEIPYPYRVLTFSDNEPLIHEKLIEAGRRHAGSAGGPEAAS